MDQQTFNLNNQLFGGYVNVFLKLVALIIFIYALILVINFLRDKFINKTTDNTPDSISRLLLFLSKLFIHAGFGFALANILQMALNGITNSRHRGVNFGGDWDYLTFGVIIIFVGMGLRYGGKELQNNHPAR